jgi:hypothetical protein
MGAQQKVIEALQEERLPFTTIEIEWVIREHGIEVGNDPKAFIEEIVAEGARRSLEVIERFIENLGIRDLPPEVGECLRKGGTAQVRCHEEREEVTILLGSGEGWKTIDLPLPSDRRVPARVDLDVEAGLVLLRVEDQLEAAQGRAFFKGYTKENIKKVLDGLKSLASFLPSMELEDLPEALEKLKTLDRWESRMEGPYVLARSAGFWTLRKGSIFGDPELDGALLLEREVNLSFPEGVEIAFSFFCEMNMTLITHLEVAWRGETVRLGDTLGEYSNFLAHPLDRDFVNKPIKNLLRYELNRLEERSRAFASDEDTPLPLEDASPRMLALLRFLARHEDPFNVLAEGKVSHYVTSELFTEF